MAGKSGKPTKPATKPVVKKPAAKPAAPTAARITARAKTDPAFLKRALANPGLRSKITDPSLLPAPQRQARLLNTRLNTPIVAGSTITGRDLAHQAAAATQVEYGPQEQTAADTLAAQQQRAGDIDRWYGQYLAQVQNYAQGVGQAEDQATNQNAALVPGVTGLGQETAQRIQGQASADAAARGVTAGNIVPLADQGTVARQALAASFAAQQANVGAAAKNYASGLANLVAPAEHLGAQTAQGRLVDKARANVAEVAKEKAAADVKFRTDKTQQEFTNQVALGTLDLKSDAAKTAATTAATKAAANTPEAQAAAAGARTTATEEARNAAKLGISVHDYRVLGPNERKRRLDALKATKAGSASDTRYASGPFSGMLKSAVNALTPDAAQKLVDKYNKKKGAKDGTKPGGGDWATNEQQGKAGVQASLLKGLATKAKAGIKFDVPAGQTAKADPKGALPRNGPNSASAKLQGYAGTKLLNSILVTAALDAVYNDPPGLSATTVRGLIDAGYKPGQIARALGVPTAGQRAASGARSPASARAGTKGAPAAGATTTSSQSRR